MVQQEEVQEMKDANLLKTGQTGSVIACPDFLLCYSYFFLANVHENDTCLNF